MKVVYVLHAFPKVGQTFIFNEMIEMKRKGVVIEVFSFNKKDEDLVQPRTQEIKNVTYFPKSNSSLILPAHVYWFFRHPIRYLKGFMLFTAFGFVALFRRGMGEMVKLFFVNLHFSMMLDRAKADHIHAHFGDYPADLAMLFHMLSGIPYTFTTHSVDLYTYVPKNYKMKSSLAKKHITISQYNKDYIIKTFHVPADRIEVIHCGVDFEMVSSRTEPVGQNILLTVGRLHHEKGLDILIQACKKLKDENIVFQSQIIGIGEERRNLERLIQQSDLEDRVRLFGHKTQEEVFSFLKKSTLMVLPSRVEGVPMVLMEAMAFKVPVISTRIYGIPELVEDGKSGFLVDPEDVDSLTDRIKKLLFDENLRKRFQEAGYEKVSREFNLKTETDKLLRIWMDPS